MKGQLESHQELDHAEESVSLAMALSTIAAALGFLLVVAGVIALQPGWAVAGLGGFTLAWAARAWLQRGEPAAGADELHTGAEATPAFDEGRARELMRLLEEWEREEAKRGTAAFDPWAVQVLRNDIRRVLASDPALEALFDQLRQAA